MASFLRDLRFALRWLTKNPGFSGVAILTLALGVGVNSTVFSLVNVFMFRPLPVRDPHQLVVLGTLDHHIDLPHYVSYGVAHNVPWRTVVDTRPFLYLPLSQNYRSGVTLQLHTDGDPLRLGSPVRAAIKSLDPSVAPYEMLDIGEHLRSGLAFGPLRLGASIATGAGALGLTVALVGLYGVMAFAVSQRTRELGVRMELGADARDLLRMVLSQGMRLTGYGLAIGLVTGWPLTRAVGSFLVGDNPVDTLLVLSAACLLALVAGLACYIPARRAARVDPVLALRYE